MLHEALTCSPAADGDDGLLCQEFLILQGTIPANGMGHSTSTTRTGYLLAAAVCRVCQGRRAHQQLYVRVPHLTIEAARRIIQWLQRSSGCVPASWRVAGGGGGLQISSRRRAVFATSSVPEPAGQEVRFNGGE